MQLRRQFNLAMNRANAPDDLDFSSNTRDAPRSHTFVQKRDQDDDGSSYDSLNHVSVEEHISSISRATQRQSAVPNSHAAAHRSPRRSTSSDDDEDANASHYRDLLSSITSKMRDNRLGGGGIEPFEIDHTSAAPVPSAASFNPYPAPISRTHTRVGEGSSGRAALLQKSSKVSAAAVAAASFAAHGAYAQPLSGVSGSDCLRPFDVAAVEERMKLMRQSYLDQVRAIAGAQAKAFTITAPNSMSARRMSQLATPGGQLRSMKGSLLIFLLLHFCSNTFLCPGICSASICPRFTLILLLGSFIALKPVIESANFVRQTSLQRSAVTPKSPGSRPVSAPSTTSRPAPAQSNGGPAAARSQVGLRCCFFAVKFQ